MRPLARRIEGSGGEASPLVRLWRKRRPIWHIVARDLSQQDFSINLLKAGVGVLLAAYVVAFLSLSPLGKTVSDPVLTDVEIGQRVAAASVLGVFMTFFLFIWSYSAQRSNGTLRSYFNHPVGVAEVVAAKFLHVLIACTAVAALVLLPLVPLVQAGVVSPERAGGLAVLGFSALAASYLCLLFGAALAFVLHDRVGKLKPEHGMIIALGLFIVDSRWFLTGAGEALLNLKAGFTGTAVGAGELDAVGTWAVVLSTPSPFEAALNVSRLALAQPAFLAGVVVSIAVVAAVVQAGLSRARRTYPEEVF